MVQQPVHRTDDERGQEGDAAEDQADDGGDARCHFESVHGGASGMCEMRER